MNNDAKEYWRTYFCRASQWAAKMTPAQYDTAVALLTDMHLGDAIIMLGKPIFVNAARHDVDSVSEYLDDPSKCVENPYVYHAMHQLPILDLKWADIMMQNRVDGYRHNVRPILEDSVEELKHPKKCFTGREVISLIRDVLKGE